jgi:cell division septation protein DedD
MENRLKQRLTGAAILVALIVMLVPEMFHGQRGNVAAIAGSSGEGPPVRSYTIDLSNSSTRTGPLQSTPVGAAGGAAGAGSGSDDAPASTPRPEQPTASTGPVMQDMTRPSRPAAQAGSAPAAAPTSPVPAATVPAAAAPVTPAPVTPALMTPAPAAVAPVVATPKPVTPSASASRQAAAATSTRSASVAGWQVQLGLFAKRDNAERLAHSAQAQGFTVSISSADAKGLYRVYAGGMNERSAAEAFAGRLKDHGLPAAVIASP